MAESAPKAPDSAIIRHTTRIVSAYVSNNPLSSADIPDFIRNVHDAMLGLSGGNAGGVSSNLKPAVPIRKSITPEYIVCLEDGRKLKMLRRYLHTRYHLSPEEYRAKWQLPADYPMVAPNYAEARSQTAKKHGLGRQRPHPAKRRKRG